MQRQSVSAAMETMRLSESRSVFSGKLFDFDFDFFPVKCWILFHLQGEQRGVVTNIMCHQICCWSCLLSLCKISLRVSV